MILLVEIIKFI